MSDHGRGVDDDLVRALQRAGRAEVGVDVNALTTGARGRARTIRRRRQGVAGAVAVFALALPIGISQWPGAQTPTTITPATSTTAAVTGIPDSALLTTEELTTVMSGLTPVEVENTVNSGFCIDTTYDGSSTVVDARSQMWGGAENVVTSPTPEAAQVDAILFRGQAATDWMALTSQDAQDCTTDALEGADFTPATADVAADEVVAGFRASTLGESNPAWQAKVVARSGQFVVRVSIDTHQPDGQAAVDQAAALATAQLDKAADLREAGGAAR
jgi:hypothetical protein